MYLGGRALGFRGSKGIQEALNLLGVATFCVLRPVFRWMRVNLGYCPSQKELDNEQIWVVVKIMVPFWIHIIIRHLIYLGYPTRDHNFDNHPYAYLKPNRRTPPIGNLALLEIDPAKDPKISDKTPDRSGAWTMTA